MIRTKWTSGSLAVLLGGCTPLGLWLYEDPVVTVSRITLELGTSSSTRARSSPVIVALAVQNVNDYPLSTKRLELSLRLDGVPIGRLKRDSTVRLAMDTISTVALALPLEKQATPARLEALRLGTHTFAVKGRATFRTPIGVRTVRFAEEGSMIFGERATTHPLERARARSSRSSRVTVSVTTPNSSSTLP
jgi:LEA14-like dessication related protein